MAQTISHIRHPEHNSGITVTFLGIRTLLGTNRTSGMGTMLRPGGSTIQTAIAAAPAGHRDALRAVASAVFIC